jgi:hypothetical protein
VHVECVSEDGKSLFSSSGSATGVYGGSDGKGRLRRDGAEAEHEPDSEKNEDEGLEENEEIKRSSEVNMGRNGFTISDTD